MGEILTFSIPEQALIRSLQEPKDFRITIRSDGTFTATCKACDAVLKTAEQGGLIW